MRTINIVGSHVEPPNGYALVRGDVTVLWSAFPAHGCDLYAYIGATSYYGPLPQPQVLMQAEPIVTQPGEYSRAVFEQFDYVFPLLDSLDGLTPRFRRWPVYVYETGPNPSPIPSVAELRDRYPADGRIDGVCMILGNKVSTVPGELYSKREEVARWFLDRSDMPFDVYGRPAFEDLPNYRGPLSAAGKRETLAKYRYTLCLENCYHPFWSRGYVTERLPECLETRTIPIYLGCHNIEDYLPSSCYIDMRRFARYGALADFLTQLTDGARANTIAAIDGWLAAGGLATYSAFRLYDMLAAVLAEEHGVPAEHLLGSTSNWQPALEQPTAASGLESGRVMHTSALSGLRRWWTWEHLEAGDAQDVDALVEWLAQGAGDPTPTPPVARKRRRSAAQPIAHVLYIGVANTHGAHPEAPEYWPLNLLAAWTGYADVDLRFVDCAEQCYAFGAAGMSQRLVDYVRREKPDLVFYVPHAVSFDVLHEAMHEITGLTSTVAWLTHHRDAFEEYSRRWPARVDHAVTVSMGDHEQFAAEGIGSNVTYAQWAFHPHTYLRQHPSRRDVVTLVGSRDQWREGVRDEFISAGLPVETYGAGWADDSYVDFQTLRRSFGESAINLNVMSRRRVFEVTGSGGFLLTTPTEDLEAAFVTDAEDRDRAEIAIATNVDELVAKAKYYLANPAEREAIAARGHDRAMREHTWFHRYAAVFTSFGWRLPKLVGTPDASPIIPIPRL